MRSNFFWEERLEKAEDRLRFLDNKRAVSLANLNYQKQRLKGLIHRHRPLRYREDARWKIDKLTSLNATLDRKIRKLRETKIPYYKEMLAKEPATVWDRLRSGDGLRV